MKRLAVNRTAQHGLRGEKPEGPGVYGPTPDTPNRSLAMELRPLGVTSLAVDRQLLEQPYREERPITGRVQTRNRRSNAALALPTALLHAPRLPVWEGRTQASRRTLVRANAICCLKFKLVIPDDAKRRAGTQGLRPPPSQPLGSCLRRNDEEGELPPPVRSIGRSSLEAIAKGRIVAT